MEIRLLLRALLCAWLPSGECPAGRSTAQHGRAGRAVPAITNPAITNPAITNLPLLLSSPVPVGCPGSAPGRRGPAAPQVRAGRGTAGLSLGWLGGWVRCPGRAYPCSFLPLSRGSTAGPRSRGSVAAAGQVRMWAGLRSGGRAPRGRAPRHLTGETGPPGCAASRRAEPGKRASTHCIQRLWG